MTVFSRPGPDLTGMLCRLRARPASSWGYGGREAAARSALQELADLAADARGEKRRTVPDVGVLALPDQLAVLAFDAAEAGVPGGVVAGILGDLAARLAVRPAGRLRLSPADSA